MSLSDELLRTVEGVRSAIPAPVFGAIEKVIASLQASNIVERAAGIGARPRLPVLPDLQGDQVELTALNAAGPLVVTFYRGGWCPYCNVALRGLQRIDADLRAHGARQVAVTPEVPANGVTTADAAGVRFPVLHDAGNGFAHTLGIVFAPSDALRNVYETIGLDLPQRNGTASQDLPLAATYVFDRTGAVAWVFKDADWTKRAEPADILAAIVALARN